MCGGMGMVDFSRLDVHAEMWIGWCKFHFFLGAFGAVWRDGDGGLVGCEMSLRDVDAMWE